MPETDKIDDILLKLPQRLVDKIDIIAGAEHRSRTAQIIYFLEAAVERGEFILKPKKAEAKP